MECTAGLESLRVHLTFGGDEVIAAKGCSGRRARPVRALALCVFAASGVCAFGSGRDWHVPGCRTRMVIARAGLLLPSAGRHERAHSGVIHGICRYETKSGERQRHGRSQWIRAR